MGRKDDALHGGSVCGYVIGGGQDAGKAKEAVAGDSGPEVVMLVAYRDEDGKIVDVQERRPGTGDTDDGGGEVVAYAVIPPAVAEVCYTSDTGEVPGGVPLSPWVVYGTVEIMDLEMIEGWTEDFHPFDTWSEEPGDPALYFHLNIPVTECDGCLPVDRCDLSLGCGEVAGTPACWYDSGDCVTRYGFRWNFGKACCYSQKLFCYLIGSIPIIGNSVCPWTYCNECSSDCRFPAARENRNPCHSCGICGGSWLLCHLPFGHC